MTYVNLILTRLFDLLLWPFGRWPAGGLVFISAIAGVVMLVIFKFASNQKKIRRSRDLINAHLLAMRLFQDEPAVLLASQRAVLKANLSYLRYALVPLVFILPPVVLIMAQLELRYGAAPLALGETAVVRAVFDGPPDEGVTLTAPPGVAVETPALRIPFQNEADWRVRAVTPGRYTLRLNARGKTYVKEFVAATPGISRVSPKAARGFFSQLLHPGESAPGDGVKEITVLYPRREDKVFGVTVSWLVTFFIVSLVAAFALKGVLRTEV